MGWLAKLKRVFTLPPVEVHPLVGGLSMLMADLERYNPALKARVETMTIPDAARTICQEYGVEYDGDSPASWFFAKIDCQVRMRHEAAPNGTTEA